MDKVARIGEMLPKNTESVPISERITYERCSQAVSETHVPFSTLQPHKSEPCWGCCNYANGALDDTPRCIANFFQFAYATYASTDTMEFYDNLHNYFIGEICESIKADNRRYGEGSVECRPVPAWSRESMREHFEHHIINPSIQNCKDTKRLKVLIDWAMDRIIVQKDDGSQDIDSKQLKNLATLFKLHDERQKQNVGSFNFYSADATTDKRVL